jgi:hypothetical protein
MTGSAERHRLSLGLVGDVCLSRGVINVVRRHGAAFLFEKVRPLFDRLDLTVGNLECCIVDHSAATPLARPGLQAPHVCQGIEWYDGGLIAYTLGNHAFDIVGNGYQRAHRGTDESMLLQVTVDFSGGRRQNQGRLATDLVATDPRARPRYLLCLAQERTWSGNMEQCQAAARSGMPALDIRSPIRRPVRRSVVDGWCSERRPRDASPRFGRGVFMVLSGR